MCRLTPLLIITICLSLLTAGLTGASTPQPSTAEEHFLLGNAYHTFGLDDNATREYRLAVGLNPNQSDIWNNLGLSLTNQKKYDEAQSALENATRLDPGDAEAWYNLGYTFGMTGKNDQEIASYEKALSIRPNMTIAWRNIGVVRYEQGNYTGAAAALERATMYDPTAAEGWYYLGTIYERTGNLTGAVTVLNKALELDQNLTMARERLDAVERNISTNATAGTVKQSPEKAPLPAAVGILAILIAMIYRLSR